MFELTNFTTLLAVAFPSSAPAAAVLIGDEKSNAVIAVHPVSSVGVKSVIIVALTLYQNVITFAVVLLPFLHCSPV